MATEKSYSGWYFLAGTLVLLVVAFFFSQEKTLLAVKNMASLFLKILPVFALILLLFIIINFFVKNSFLLKHMGKDSGFKGLLFSIVAGILSAGPIYAWYPLLSDLQDKGVRNGLIAVFLYNRAIKFPLLPLLVSFFTLRYAVVLLVVMIVVSVLQAWVVDYFTSSRSGTNV